MYDIIFYKDKHGREPITEYLDELRSNVITNKDSRTKNEKIYKYFEIIERMGTRAGLPYITHVEGDIWGLRPLKDRFFFLYCKGDKLIALHHFYKKTKKTPQKEINQAKRNLNDYLERIDNFE